MKTRLSLFCIAMALIAASAADAQLARPLIGGGHARSAFHSVSGDLLRPTAGRPGRVWIEASAADKGLGFDGSYITVGAKTRLFEDRLDGRWLFQGQFNHSLEEDGGAFANLGIERVFSLDSAGADVSLGGWYDYDGDEHGNFAHTFHQVGVTGSIKTRKWDLIGNGYLPVGVQDYTTGTGVAGSFFGNNIALTPGIDSALQGFDVTLRMRPKQLAFVNGTLDLGGYHYDSDTVDAFGGGRVRLGFQILNGMMVSAEVNTDERFDTTGVLGVGWVFGANASGYGHEYSGIGRDLERTVRNDHIVRFNQGFELAIDPETGRAYNVVHVNNNGDPAFHDGTAERPYASLASAQNGSSEGDIILVSAGDGTDRNMETGIRLKNDQSLFGSAESLLIPIQGGISFALTGDGSGQNPTISNSGGFSVVQLADNNEVGGLNIDGTGARFGIWGNGNSGNIRDNTITNARDDGIRLNGVTGNWDFARNDITGNGGHGVFMFNALDPTSEITFAENTVSENGLDGIHLRNYDPAVFNMVRNTTNDNLRNGLFLENYLNSQGNDLQIIAHNANGNAGNGIFMNFGSGDLDFINTLASNNLGSGILIRNWATAADERIFVGTSEGGVSTLSNNRAPANLQFVLDTPGIDSNAIVTGMTLSDGVRGIGARVAGVTAAGDQTTLDIDIIDNLEINRNINDGIRLVALDGGLITTEIGNTNLPLQMIDNARGGGAGISLLADGINGRAPAEIRALIDNVTIINQESRVIRPGLADLVVPTDGVGVDSVDNAVVDVTVRNATIGVAANGTGTQETQNGIRVELDNNNDDPSLPNIPINRITLDNLTMFSNFGVVFTTGDGTRGDLSLSNSTLLPQGAQTIGIRSDNSPFVDGVGTNGVFVSAFGDGTFTGTRNVTNMPDLPLEYSAFEFVSDGRIDNLTRVRLENNVIQDFTLEGVDITSQGDAHVVVEMVGNTIQNNGAGFNDDNDNDDVYGEQAADGVGVADPNNLNFYDGINIDAFDQSVISARITNNVMVDNFERGLSINTFNAATINALVGNNTFFGNDRGEDEDNTLPRQGVGTATGGEAPIADSGFRDFEAINNEEFYRRFHESGVFTNGATGVPIDPVTGDNLTMDATGIALEANDDGFDFFGNPIAKGVANLNLSMTSNALQLGADVLDFSLNPGDFRLGLDGLTNGFGPVFGTTNAGFNQAGGLIAAEESFFDMAGF